MGADTCVRTLRTVRVLPQSNVRTEVTMPKSVSIRYFAELDGCDESLVRRAIGKGQLHLDENRGLDPALAGSGWRKGNRAPSTRRCPTCHQPLKGGAA